MPRQAIILWRNVCINTCVYLFYEWVNERCDSFLFLCVFFFIFLLSARARARSVVAMCKIYDRIVHHIYLFTIHRVPFACCHGFVSPMPTNVATISSDRARLAHQRVYVDSTSMERGGLWWQNNGEIIRIISIVLDVPAECMEISMSLFPSPNMPLYSNSLWFCCTENYIITLYAIVQVFGANICRRRMQLWLNLNQFFPPLFLAVANKDIFYSRKFHCIRSGQQQNEKWKKTLQNRCTMQTEEPQLLYLIPYVCCVLRFTTIDIRYSQHTTENSTQLQRAHNCEIYSMGFLHRCPAIGDATARRTANHSWPTIAIGMLQFNAVYFGPSLCEKLEKLKIPNSTCRIWFYLFGMLFPFSSSMLCDANHAVADSLKTFSCS